jgi:hypothetical protein
VQASSKIEGKASVDIQVPEAAGKVGIRAVKQTDGSMKAAYYAPFAFKFWLVTWDPTVNGWSVIKYPNEAPIAKGVGTHEGEDSSENLLAEAPVTDLTAEESAPEP